MANKYMKNCSLSLAIKEIQVTTLRFHLTQVRMTIITNTTTNAGKDAGGKQSISTVSGNANFCNYYGKQYGASLKN
jgi:hypothetical protein